MSEKPYSFRTVFSTPWFEIEESILERQGEMPYYRLTGPDGVICMPFTPEGEILMVRQHRPILNLTTLEIPAGAIEDGEHADQAAEREILEETGHTCSDLVELGPARLHLSRNTHTEHFILGFNARPSDGAVIEAGIELAIVERAWLKDQVEIDMIEQATALSLVGLALAKLDVDLLRDPIDLIRERALDYAERKNQDVR
ncbi:MAG TPA: NUDIX domain-containing protein [Magnetospirillaceae bacterium]|jgi:8-oxo-dGTP pyrophosphatase MutT (NUDIX family)